MLFFFSFFFSKAMEQSFEEWVPPLFVLCGCTTKHPALVSCQEEDCLQANRHANEMILDILQIGFATENVNVKK